jgi:hypothetical protein
MELDETTTCRGSFEQAAVKATVAITVTETFVSIRHHNVCMAPCHPGSDRAPAALPNARYRPIADIRSRSMVTG